ncbi:MAG: polysaccharide biosynthesis tyrosine autokinase [Bacteroidales bacterium]|nr:polysaccharide biosynthesis tyrosine autokinase [Bacteroidales bacterium]
MVKKSEEIFQQKTDYKDLIFKLLRQKHWFIISAVVFIGITYIFNKLTVPQYRNQTVLLLKEEEKNSFLTSQDIMQGFGLFGANQNIENELGVLQSFSLINSAITQLNLEVTIFKENYHFGNVLKYDFLKDDKEIYGKPPVQISIDKSNIQPINLPIYFKILNDKEVMIETFGFNVQMYDYLVDDVVFLADTVRIKGVYKFGDEIKGKYFNFKVHLLDKQSIAQLQKEKTYFVFNNLNALTLMSQASISAVNTSKTSSLVVITMSGDNKYKISDFLNTLSNAYLERNLEKKNRIAINTVKFIDSQISEVSDSLTFAESKLQRFRTNNQVMDISYQGQQSIEQMSQLESEKAILMVQQKYYNYIKGYFEKNKDMSDLVAPASMNVQDPLLNQMISQLITLNSERTNLLNQGNVKNLRLNTIEVQVSNLKKTILENILSNAATTDIALQDINNRAAKISSTMSRLPSTERQLFGIERTFKLNDAIYTFLLQKRSEAQIARASNTPDYEVIDPARHVTTALIYPKKTLNYIIAILAGLVLPFVIIVLGDFLNMKITSKKEIENLSSLPIIGHVFHNDTKNKIVISEATNSPISESFRSIRTNLQFYSRGIDKQVILITSSYSGEGKSFIAQNLASVFALFGKKTLLIGFDLRRPKLYQDFNLSNKTGISTALINKAAISEIIQPTLIQNLDFISAGPIPPNPLELIASEKTDQVFSELRKIYDYIIIDSPPVGVVSDAYLLMKYSDVNLYTVRQGFTNKEAFTTNTKHMLQKNIPHVSIVINDVKARGMLYDYGYEYTYYAEEKKKSLYDIFRKKKRKTSPAKNKKNKVKS